MEYTYFTRAYEHMAWKEVYNECLIQQNKGSKKFKYKCIFKILVDDIKFNNITKEIVKCLYGYQVPFYDSICDSKGIFNCIVFKCKENSKDIIIYTGGEMYPLYVGTTI